MRIRLFSLLARLLLAEGTHEELGSLFVLDITPLSYGQRSSATLSKIRASRLFVRSRVSQKALRLFPEEAAVRPRTKIREMLGDTPGCGTSEEE